MLGYSKFLFLQTIFVQLTLRIDSGLDHNEPARSSDEGILILDVIYLLCRTTGLTLTILLYI